MSSLKYYKTFGQVQPPAHTRHPRLWPWLLLAGIIGVAGLAGILILVLRTYRGDFEKTQIPPYAENLVFRVDGRKFQVGETASIAITLTNPGEQAVWVKGAEITLPPEFLAGFTVDDSRASVERRPDASGVLKYGDFRVPAGGRSGLIIPIQASRPGNYQSPIHLRLDLAVPLAQHPWYVPVDAGGNYAVVLERSIAPDVRVVVKP